MENKISSNVPPLAGPKESHRGSPIYYMHSIKNKHDMSWLMLFYRHYGVSCYSGLTMRIMCNHRMHPRIFVSLLELKIETDKRWNDTLFTGHKEESVLLLLTCKD